MLNEERVILMTHMASYEQNEGKTNVNIGNYFRADYIAIQVMKSVVCATIAYAMVFALFLFYDFENFMQDIYKVDLLTFGKGLLKWYVITVVVYGVISYGIYSYRYARARKSLKNYYHNLKKLNAMYHNEQL